MRYFHLGALAATTILVGCGNPAERAHSSHQGRYLGIGIYSPGAIWRELAGVKTPTNAAQAKLDDDEQVIVTVDSVTGEVRQCGNLSGYCINTNPWRGPLGQAQSAPLRLAKHRADLERATQDEAKGPNVRSAPR